MVPPPKYIKIGPVSFSVKFISGLARNTEKLSGLISFDNSHILVEDNDSLQRQRLVLMHEVVHGIMENAGYLEEGSNENLVDMLAHGFTAVLRENPEFVVYMTEKEIVENTGDRESIGCTDSVSGCEGFYV